MPLLYTALTLVLIIAFFLFAKVRLCLEYKKYPDEKPKKELHLKIGFVKLDFLFENILDRKKIKKQKGRTKNTETKNLKKKISDITSALEIIKKVYSKNRWYIRKKFKVEDLSLHIKFGSGDAAQTGILTGAIWSLLYAFLAFLCTAGTVKEHFFEVVPVYDECGFASVGKIKLSVRMINMISVALRLYLTYKKISKQSK